MNVLIRSSYGYACAWNDAVRGLLDEELERVEHEVGPEPHVPAVAAVERRHEVPVQRRAHRARGAVGPDDQVRPPELGQRRRLGREPQIDAQRDGAAPAGSRAARAGRAPRTRGRPNVVTQPAVVDVDVGPAREPLGDRDVALRDRRARTPSASRPRTRPRTRTRRSARCARTPSPRSPGATLRIRIEKYSPAGPAADYSDPHREPSHAEVGQVLVLEREPVDDVVHQRERGADVRRARSAAGPRRTAPSAPRRPRAAAPRTALSSFPSRSTAHSPPPPIGAIAQVDGPLGLELEPRQLALAGALDPEVQPLVGVREPPVERRRRQRSHGPPTSPASARRAA